MKSPSLFGMRLTCRRKEVVIAPTELPSAINGQNMMDRAPSVGEQSELPFPASLPFGTANQVGGVFYEFFAGAGMARAGLGNHWRCLFANDFDEKKAAAYRLNWDAVEFLCRDINEVTLEDLPGTADLAWASFPCQDLSLAGSYKGLDGHRSAAFWPFCRLLAGLGQQNRDPSLVVIENVCGTLTSRKGLDFIAICATLSENAYKFGCLVLDAANFVPQSRPRLFIIAVKDHLTIPPDLAGNESGGPFHTTALKAAYLKLPSELKKCWIWWNLGLPPQRNVDLSGIIENSPQSVKWHSAIETNRLLDMMSPLHLNKVHEAKRKGGRWVGALYKRTRRDQAGQKRQRAEVRFDGLAGCLRTPGGGSSRQFIVVVEDGGIRTRLMSSRETARLMGIPDEYKLPDNYNDAYHLTGDGVVVPVVRFLASEIIEPMLRAN